MMAREASCSSATCRRRRRTLIVSSTSALSSNFPHHPTPAPHSVRITLARFLSSKSSDPPPRRASSKSG